VRAIPTRRERAAYMEQRLLMDSVRCSWVTRRKFIWIENKDALRPCSQKRNGLGCGTDWIHFTQHRDKWRGSCELGNEPSGSIKYAKFLGSVSWSYLDNQLVRQSVSLVRVQTSARFIPSNAIYYN
jgi:hypothetical protein